MKKIKNLIVGDGLLGLMLADRLRQSHPSVMVVAPTSTTRAREAGQSRWCQGILHNGQKYVIEGDTSAKDTQADVDRWMDWEQSWKVSIPILSTHMELMSVGDAPQVKRLRNAKKAVTLIACWSECVRTHTWAEYVIDCPQLLEILRARLYRHTVHSDLVVSHECGGLARQFAIKDQTVEPERIFLCAGAGNAELWRLLTGSNGAVQQLRPCGVGILRAACLPFVNAHLVHEGIWELTITSQRDAMDVVTWHLGGPVYDRQRDLQNARAIELLPNFFKPEYLPDLDKDMQYITVRRAEYNSGGKRKLDPAVLKRGHIQAGWPTKAVFIPRLIETMLQ
jgi:hypothetical protein